MKTIVVNPRRQHGVALLTVLMVFALAAFIAADLALTGISVTEHAAVRQDARQAYYYALGAEVYARELLWQDRSADVSAARNADGRQDLWPDGIGRFNLDEGAISIQVTDLQGRFNLANLVSATGAIDMTVLGQLQRLLAQLGFDTALSGRIVDWIDVDGEASAQGADDGFDQRSDAPHSAAKAPPVGLAELVSVLALSTEKSTLFSRFLTSLPEATKLNINTSAPETLLAVAGPRHASAARALHNQQSGATFADLDEVLAAHGLGHAQQLREALSTDSQWFEIDVLAVYRQRVARLRSMVHRDPRSGVTRVIYRSPVGRVKAE